MADESRYVTRSALIGTQPSQNRRSRRLTWSECQWLRKLARVGAGAHDLPLRQQPLRRAARRQRRQQRDGAPAIGDLDTLASLNVPQQLARALSELANAHAHHVLVVAHALPP